ncbi:MAG: hypothetical protein ABL966_07775 [Acidimicrobiales bacterium]
MGVPMESDQRMLVRSLWLAHREGRTDDLLAMLGHDVEWLPMSRPGRSLYEGHDGVRLMLEDAKRANGTYWVELDEMIEPAPDLVRATARVITPNPTGPPNEVPIRLAIWIDGDLVVRVEATLAD